MVRFLLNSYLILPEDISHLQTDLQKKTCVTVTSHFSDRIWRPIPMGPEGLRYPQFQWIWTSFSQIFPYLRWWPWLGIFSCEKDPNVDRATLASDMVSFARTSCVSVESKYQQKLAKTRFARINTFQCTVLSEVVGMNPWLQMAKRIHIMMCVFFHTLAFR